MWNVWFRQFKKMLMSLHNPLSTSFFIHTDMHEAKKSLKYIIENRDMGQKYQYFFKDTNFVRVNRQISRHLSKVNLKIWWIWWAFEKSYEILKFWNFDMRWFSIFGTLIWRLELKTLWGWEHKITPTAETWFN